MELLALGNAGLQSIPLSEGEPHPLDLGGTVNRLRFSRDGGLLAAVLGHETRIFRVDPFAELCTIPEAPRALLFSPRNKFLLTWTKETASLSVWDLASVEKHVSFPQPRFKEEDWPYLKWTDDEMFVARKEGEKIVFFNGRNLVEGPISELRLANLMSFDLAPLPPKGRFGDVPRPQYFFMTFCEGTSKSSPARASLYSFPDMMSLASKSFFSSDSVSCAWNGSGEFALVKGSTEVVKDSYYGSSRLHLLCKSGDALTVVNKDISASIADAQWSPVAREFVVIEGRQATLYNAKDCSVIFEFGDRAWNTIRWSRHGRFIMLGGFGNMVGDFTIWDRTYLKQIGSGNAHSAKYFEWAPDGIHFITASIFPWRRVDNEIKIWKYSGELVKKIEFGELYHVLPRDQDTLLFTYPAPLLSEAESSKLSSLQKKKIKADTKNVYVPPHLRKKSGTDRGAIGGSLRRPGSITSKSDPSSPRVSGIDEAKVESKSSLPRKACKSTDAAVPDKDPATKSSGSLLRDESTAGSEDDTQKKIRQLKKKLRQIEQLKEKRDSGVALNEDMLKKISSEKTLLAELKALE